MSLATKYRPKDFEEVSSQRATIQILKKQLETKQFSNCYLISGPTGTGKTTLARIFANKINEGRGEPIEIDGASHNGVDSIRALVEESKARSLNSKYKIFIVDECHAISGVGWNAFLKCIEEIPPYTMFLFCTTNPEKVPQTIQNRTMKFHLTKIPLRDIVERLTYICEQEHLNATTESLEYIAKLAQGGMRDAITYLETCTYYSNTLSIENVLACLGDFSYESFFNLTNYLIDGKEKEALSLVDKWYEEGKDLGLFLDQYLSFTLDLLKYCLFKNMQAVQIPALYLKEVSYTTACEDNAKYFGYLTDSILNLKILTKNDPNIKCTVEIKLLAICRGN